MERQHLKRFLENLAYDGMIERSVEVLNDIYDIMRDSIMKKLQADYHLLDIEAQGVKYDNKNKQDLIKNLGMYNLLVLCKINDSLTPF